VAKQLPPSENPDVPREFLDAVEKEADRRVEELATVAERILAQVPERVALRIKSFRATDWGAISLALSSPTAGELEYQP
jgi:hypothetical protein